MLHDKELNGQFAVISDCNPRHRFMPLPGQGLAVKVESQRVEEIKMSKKSKLEKLRRLFKPCNKEEHHSAVKKP